MDLHELIIFIIVYIVIKIYFTAVLFKTRSKVIELEETLKDLKRRMSNLQNILDGLKTRDAAFDKESVPENISALEDKAEKLKQEHTPLTAENENLQSPFQRQTESAETQHNPPLEEEFQPRHQVSAFSLWIKKQCTIESVISKLGILLLLIGIGYIFKLAYDRGFIGKEFLLAAGCGIGLVLTGLGFVVHRKKRLMLSQVLFGGSIVTFYLTAFAAYMRYSVLSDVSAFFFLALITVCAYFLAAATASVSVSVIGLTGSLFIPFALGFEFFDLTSFGLYVFAVSALSTVIYFFKRWRILQFSASLAFLSVLTWLLLRTTLTPPDAQLFLLLVMLLWITHLIPDFYFHLSGKETRADKIVSPIAAIINYTFSLFFAFTLSSYHPLPEGSIYLTFVFFYALFSYICLKKDKLKTLGYTFIALGILSVYVTLIDFLTYDIRPAAALGFAIFLSWLWRKEEDKTLQTAIRIVSLIGYTMALYTLIIHAPKLPALSFTTHASIYAVPMFALVFMQKRRERRLAQTIAFQIYTPLVLFIVLDKVLQAQHYIVFHYQLTAVDPALFYALITLVLWTLYSILHYRSLNTPDNRPFYEQSLYAAPLLICSLIVVHTISALYERTVSEYGRHLLPVVSMEVFCAGGLLMLSRFKQKTERNRFAHYVSFYSIVLKLLLIDGPRIVNLIRHAYRTTNDASIAEVFYWGIFLAGLFILLIDRYYVHNSQAAKTVKVIGKLIIGIAALLYYPFIYLPEMKRTATFGIVPFIVNTGNMLIFLKILAAVTKKRTILFFALTAAFVFLSFTDIYLATKNNGILTLVWGFYTIAAFVYFLRKVDRTLVYVSLALIIVVSAKLIIIDLGTIGIISKTVTSILLGAALLILSYAVQPMLKKFQEKQ